MIHTHTHTHTGALSLTVSLSLADYCLLTAVTCTQRKQFKTHTHPHAHTHLSNSAIMTAATDGLTRRNECSGEGGMPGLEGLARDTLRETSDVLLADAVSAESTCVYTHTHTHTIS